MTILIELTSCGDFEHFTVQQETEKAWKINGQWFPKSGFTEDVSEWVNSIDKVTVMRNVSYRIKPWLYKKLDNRQQKALGLLM
ncbi:hypothetical protein [Chroococcidiopsis sp.]|uniref:hypothetical protein n=1 Tax=Chroococcidiopsis sp. TaxID=3088168 RepID=UPI003F2DD8BB